MSRTRVAKLADSIEIVHENTCLHKSWNFLFRLRQRKSKEQADVPEVQVSCGAVRLTSMWILPLEGVDPCFQEPWVSFWVQR